MTVAHSPKMTHILIRILLLISFTFSSASAASVFFSRGNLTVLASTDYIFQILLDQSIPAGEILSVTFSNGFTVPSGPLSICTLDNANLAGISPSLFSPSIIM